MRHLIKFIATFFVASIMVIYIFVMLTQGSAIILIVMMAALGAAIFVFAPLCGEWLEQ